RSSALDHAPARGRRAGCCSLLPLGGGLRSGLVFGAPFSFAPAKKNQMSAPGSSRGFGRERTRAVPPFVRLGEWATPEEPTAGLSSSRVDGKREIGRKEADSFGEEPADVRRFARQDRPRC